MNIKAYLKYANTAEARAVLFVKKYLKRADNRVWVDILNYYDCNSGNHDLQFAYVKCELFPRKTQPEFVSRRCFNSKHDYIMACRAATWEAAHYDIKMLRQQDYHGPIYIIRGDMVCTGSGKFRPGTPPEILALAENPNDRTDPLWDEAMKYIDSQEKFQIKSIRRVT